MKDLYTNRRKHMNIIKTDENYIRSTLVRRERDAHKGDFGKVLVFAGSPGMAGAAVLCARGALYGGAGLVRFLVDSYNSPVFMVLQSAVPEATCLIYDKRLDLSEYSAIAIGPGLGKGEDMKSILGDILDRSNTNLVIDADGLNFISADEALAEKVRSYPGTVIMTPHIGEARRLLGRDDEIKSQEQRIAALCEISEKYNSVVLLKGSETLVGCPALGEEIYQNTTGNPGMATGGSGDVLTGVIAALCAQGYSPLDSTRIGAFVHGLAGDIAAETYGEISLLSSNITAFIPVALKRYYPKD